MSRQRVSSGVQWEQAYSYSRAVRVGNRILVAGTTATDPDGEAVGLNDPTKQADYVIDKIEQAIRQLGGRIEDVVRTRIYISNLDHWEAVAQVHGRRFAGISPANTLVKAELIGEEYLVEMEAEAVVEE